MFIRMLLPTSHLQQNNSAGWAEEQLIAAEGLASVSAAPLKRTPVSMQLTLGVDEPSEHIDGPSELSPSS